MRLGNRVMALLDVVNKKPSELADAIGAPRNTVYGWKEQNRNPSSEYVIPICSFFNMTPNELFGFDATTAELDDEERELLDHFRALGKIGRRAVLAEVDEQLYRQKLEGDNSKTATS